MYNYNRARRLSLGSRSRSISRTRLQRLDTILDEPTKQRQVQQLEFFLKIAFCICGLAGSKFGLVELSDVLAISSSSLGFVRIHGLSS